MLGIDERWSGGIDALVSEANRLLATLLPQDRAARLKDEVNARLVRHYTTVGLLPAPTREGREARYGRAHLLGLLALRRLMADGLSGKALAGALTGRSEEDLADLARTGVTGENPSAPSGQTFGAVAGGPLLAVGNIRLPNPALAYLEGLRRPAEQPLRPVPAREVKVLRSRKPERDLVGQVAPAPQGEVWRRVTIAPGLEVQVSSTFRAPGSEARWADLLRRVRDALADPGS